MACGASLLGSLEVPRLALSVIRRSEQGRIALSLTMGLVNYRPKNVCICSLISPEIRRKVMCLITLTYILRYGSRQFHPSSVDHLS